MASCVVVGSKAAAAAAAAAGRRVLSSREIKRQLVTVSGARINHRRRQPQTLPVPTRPLLRLGLGNLASPTSFHRWHGGGPTSGPTVNVTFLQPNGETKITVPAFIGESLLQVAHRHEIDLEGACEGVCACSTCHLILPHAIYDGLPEPSEDEEDMLDMAFGLTETSRLGCQVLVTAEMEGVVLEMPKATRNFYVDGHKPKPH